MKIALTACATALAMAFAVTTATPSLADSTKPGASPSSRPGAKPTPTPPAPPRGQFDKNAFRTAPPGSPPPRGPKPVDDIAGTPNRGKQAAWEQTCRDSVHCEFLRSLCTAKGGGMSTNPDGSETCTVYEGPVVSGSYSGPVRPPKPPRADINTLFGNPRGPQPYVVKWTCKGEQSCAYLDYGCSMVGGGMSTNRDGSQTCTVES